MTTVALAAGCQSPPGFVEIGEMGSPGRRGPSGSPGCTGGWLGDQPRLMAVRTEAEQRLDEDEQSTAGVV
ncbi:hypothetical protein [Actinocatenispora rupis]|uniref:hypothetical protein n=1 Tax=Actinocatenispora rupis TaxID=519421 RepID=UPI001941F827|nr:hypothetical protein [Actinocatenispora rupis]